jgi:putative ABC transport system substrate-binding protein
MSSRREFITLIGGAAAWPLAARAQAPSKRPLIGFLGTSAKAAAGRYFDGFSQGMRELGYVSGSDYAFEDRYADNDSGRLPALAEELVRLKPDVVVAAPTIAALAMKKATSDIPIVAVTITDPVGFGLVVSEARPGTNVTGILSRVPGLPAKQLEIALDVMPTAAKIGVLIDGNDPSNVVQRREVEAAVANLHSSLAPAEVRSADEIRPALQTFVRQDVPIVIVFGGPMFLAARRQIAAAALALRLPTVYNFRDHVEDGGLISYGTNLRESFRRAAYFVDRILKGARPADLPIEFPTKVELAINLATARALALTVPPTLLALADEVIE